ncbi:MULTISPECIES: 6,7-dimethyl-8-ribityllumazine synthase [Methylobacterium]|uniref:6,7-dimethyl-8-ribityllumazine synthase n=1 Tax=Methylobacterium bullatum TaxID=570505 RepID=A0A679K0M7_9HYPH|nr:MULTISPECIES: 6,7-dimethyl-8-ribityllumazine synthase [Methylobacterium]KQO45798.1 6,7-dimethyl-8-ribityllumazine synthase [Methylobacterium sp. Leaf85]KQP52151.1 6,7-dimethyl-8-ribityllumazine synthase [Methylobacterium sp. Leaf106]MBD8902269.1 6,7-dimethyl-8-ribityllumazine synthase [Methylobacterium bullatum]TXN31787.1 6,7-dimethyl-8-ribityllumazine synthase [Methylobacterium sp. WL19]CAA2103609.1 6,7-dimethyl-8-ribityllumazine synthase 1 [Methylobacterium bullatum]
MVSPSPAARPAPPTNVKGARVLVVEARYYDDISDELLAGAQGALDAAEAEGVVVTVPGALEIPAAIAILVEEAARAGQPYDAAVALGCVIRGETGHYDIVATESARALMDLSVIGRLPLGNGILTVETMEQALARARVSDLNKGAGAADAALAVLALKRAAAAAPVGED